MRLARPPPRAHLWVNPGRRSNRDRPGWRVLRSILVQRTGPTAGAVARVTGSHSSVPSSSSYRRLSSGSASSISSVHSPLTCVGHRQASISTTMPTIISPGSLSLPARRVPVPAAIRGRFDPGGIVDRPDHQVRGTHRNHLLAARAPVWLPSGRARHRAHQEIAVAGLLGHSAAQRGRVLVRACRRPSTLPGATQRSVRASGHLATVAPGSAA